MYEAIAKVLTLSNFLKRSVFYAKAHNINLSVFLDIQENILLTYEDFVRIIKMYNEDNGLTNDEIATQYQYYLKSNEKIQHKIWDDFTLASWYKVINLFENEFNVQITQLDKAKILEELWKQTKYEYN